MLDESVQRYLGGTAARISKPSRPGGESRIRGDDRSSIERSIGMFRVALLVMSVVGQGSGDAELSYEAAFQKADRENKPLLIMVGAPWCASCQIMKRETLETMHRDGELKDVVFTFVNRDERPELAEKLLRGQTLPQIIVYKKSSGAWKRFSVVGMQSVGRMRELLARVRGTAGTTQLLR
ncbi:MAG: thioredoxin [Planctomycetota bacterium]|nr:MAG: thioredoxin [Planctomycetota bacterium]